MKYATGSQAARCVCLGALMSISGSKGWSDCARKDETVSRTKLDDESKEVLDEFLGIAQGFG
jgi:hypothetical protein